MLVYLFKSKSGSIHLNPIVGRNLQTPEPHKLFASKYIICFDSYFGS